MVSDAGTPGISDPGAVLIKECIKENINILIEYLNNDISNKLNLNLYLLKLNDDIFYNSNINYIDFNKFEVYTDIVFNKKIEEVSRIKELFENAYPYFDFKKSKNKKDNYYLSITGIASFWGRENW